MTLNCYATNCRSLNATILYSIFVPTVEKGEKLCIRECFNFFRFFVFHTKSATTNIDRTGLNDISYEKTNTRGVQLITANRCCVQGWIQDFLEEVAHFKKKLTKKSLFWRALPPLEISIEF